jgi:hypothetical protein
MILLDLVIVIARWLAWMKIHHHPNPNDNPVLLSRPGIYHHRCRHCRHHHHHTARLEVLFVGCGLARVVC